MKKILIVGLGNIGLDYVNTRHNIGFKILDAFSYSKNIDFNEVKYGQMAETSIKGKKVYLLKPSTFMNLSGKALRYWLEAKKIELNNTLIITDDIHLDFGTFRIKPKGSHGGHNGLKNIESLLNTSKYPRFRFGVGNEFSKGRQVDYVLGTWSEDQQSILKSLLKEAISAIETFVFQGIDTAMNQHNGKQQTGQN